MDGGGYYGNIRGIGCRHLNLGFNWWKIKII